MKYTATQFAALLLPISLALAKADYDPSKTVVATAESTTTVAPNAPLGTAFDGAQDLDPNNLPPTVTQSPAANGAHANAVAVDVEHVTINIFNSMTVPVNVFHVSDPANPPLEGMPGPGAIPPAQATAIVMPANFIGQSTVGTDNPPDGQGTKVEMSLSPDPNQGGDHIPYVDVSYVDGYSIPMTCSCNGAVVTGCNIELWNTGIACSLKSTGQTCLNPHAHESQDFHGPADPFFAPCEGAAYTFPADNLGTMGCPGATSIDCCVGVGCPAPDRQKPAPAKRPVGMNFRG